MRCDIRWMCGVLSMVEKQSKIQFQLSTKHTTIIIALALLVILQYYCLVQQITTRVSRASLAELVNPQPTTNLTTHTLFVTQLVCIYLGCQ